MFELTNPNAPCDLAKLQSSIMQHEGSGPVNNGRYLPYVDTTNHLSIGYGRNLHDRGLSSDEVQLLLSNDIRDVLAEATGESWWPHVAGNDARARACLEIIYNIGINGFRGFKDAIACLLNDDFAGAGAAFLDSLWHQQTGQRAEVLATMIITGTDP